jgi:hypothetical protein
MVFIKILTHLARAWRDGVRAWSVKILHLRSGIKTTSIYVTILNYKVVRNIIFIIIIQTSSEFVALILLL